MEERRWQRFSIKRDKSPESSRSFSNRRRQTTWISSPDRFRRALHASGGDPDRVTRQAVGIYITEFAKGTKQGAVGARGPQKPRPPRTINHRLSVLASYFEYCIRRDTEDGRGPWKGRINPASAAVEFINSKAREIAGQVTTTCAV